MLYKFNPFGGHLYLLSKLEVQEGDQWAEEYVLISDFPIPTILKSLILITILEFYTQ